MVVVVSLVGLFGLVNMLRGGRGVAKDVTAFKVVAGTRVNLFSVIPENARRESLVQSNVYFVFPHENRLHDLIIRYN